ARPPGPATTASTSLALGSIVITMSLPLPSSARSAAARAPRCRRAATGADATSKAVTLKPAFNRLAAIGNPIRPSPTKPILSITLPSVYSAKRHPKRNHPVSWRHDSPVAVVGNTSDVGSLPRGEEGDKPSDFLRLGESAQR